MTNSFVPGEVVVRRYFKGDQITFLNVLRVVRDDERGLVLWMPVGAPFLRRMTPDGRTLHDGALHELGETSLRQLTWKFNDLVVWMPAGEAYSVWWFFDRDGAFSHWYLNLEQPFVRWIDKGVAGVDTVDLALDVVIQADRSWQWKDEDEFEARIGQPHYWDAAQANQIRALGERVIRLVEAGAFPFDGTWCDFRPDSTWTVPGLPAGYDRPRARP